MLAGHTGRGGLGAGGLAGDAGRRRALTAREKAALPVTAYDAADERFAGQEECCICLSAFEAADPVRALPTCSHVYHAACLDNWFDVASTCPICRKTAAALAASPTRGAAADGGGARGRARRVWHFARRVFLWPPMRDGQGQAQAHDGVGEEVAGERNGGGTGHDGGGRGPMLPPRMGMSLALPVGSWGGWPFPVPGNVRAAGAPAEGRGRPPVPGRERQERELELEVVFHDASTLTAASSFASQPPEAEPEARAAGGADVGGECCDDEDDDPLGAHGSRGGGFLPSLLLWQTRPSSSVVANEEDAEAAEGKVEEDTDAGLWR